MSKNDYEVFNEPIKSADEFEALILRLPEDEVEDKLAYLAQEKGRINKMHYEDFIIATCVANLNVLLQNINNNTEYDLVKVREEVIKLIIKHNPKLDPSNLVINKNYVIKTLKTKKPGKGEKLLTENKIWNEDFNDPNQQELDDELMEELEKFLAEEEESIKKSKKSGIKDIKDLKFDRVKKWWPRINKYVVIKKFRPEDIESILNNRYFHNHISFNTFVASVCLEDFEGTLSLLDEMGVTARITSVLLIHELYGLCNSCNAFLTFENCRKINGNKPPTEGCSSGSCATKQSGSGTDKYNKFNKKDKKLFKDVPKEDLLTLAEAIKVSLVGQDEAIHTLVDSIQRASVGLKDPNKPIGSFLFAGRTGVGKTQATKVLAEELIKGRDSLVTIDCSEYSAEHEYAKLIGSPAGYVGHEAGGFLTNAINKNPFSVVVFDEVEKASRKVHELLLQVLEEGRLTDGKGKTVNFSNTIIIMTSNVGVSEIDKVKQTIGFGNVAVLTEEKKDKALDSALKSKFKPEFLNRIDSIVHFRSLSKKDYMKIIDIELYKLNDNLRMNDTEFNGLWLEFDNRIKNLIYKEGIDSDYGARPLKRCIEKIVATPLARKLLAEDVDKNAVISISANRGKPLFKVKMEKPEELKEKEASHGCGEDCDGSCGCGGNK